MFRAGQKVVCVNAGRHPRGAASAPNLVEGEIYEIIETYINTGDVMLRVSGCSTGWISERFRPVVERKTSIEIFRRMLTPQKESTNV